MSNPNSGLGHGLTGNRANPAVLGWGGTVVMIPGSVLWEGGAGEGGEGGSSNGNGLENMSVPIGEGRCAKW